MAAQQRPNVARLPRLDLERVRAAGAQAGVAQAVMTPAAAYSDVLPSPSLWMRTPHVPAPPGAPHPVHPRLMAQSQLLVQPAPSAVHSRHAFPATAAPAQGAAQHEPAAQVQPSGSAVKGSSKRAALVVEDAQKKMRRADEGATTPAPPPLFTAALPAVAPKVALNAGSVLAPSQAISYAHVSAPPAVVATSSLQTEEVAHDDDARSSDRKAMKAIRNREAAMKSRQKEKNRLALMESENERMARELERIKKLNNRLQEALGTTQS
mmetsp:Transcript_14870/g.39812  ORF Transcript_14870/g.39812 Transcript_14870/m.39812 type:complete len:266 (-) Transcript_14870:655-1452(-)